jgi:hypothetical protein
MLGMIAKLSPCSEQRLIDLVAGQAGSRSLRSRNKSIHQSVRDLQAQGFVGMEDDQLVVTEAGKCRLIKSGMEAMDDTRGFYSSQGLKAPGVSDARLPPSTVAEQHQDAQPWRDAASGFEKAVEALRTVEHDAPFELSPELMLPDAFSGFTPEISEEVPLELNSDLALPVAGANQGSLLALEEKIASSITERHGLRSGESDSTSLSQVYGWGEGFAVTSQVPRFAWLIENIPRRMRAHSSLAAEIRVSSSIANDEGADPVDNSTVVLQAISLRLLAPEGGFVIEAQSPETQWVRGNFRNELAAWRFIITANKRGFKSLKLAFSYKVIGPNGLLMEGALPDRMFDVVISANFQKTLTRAFIWITSLVIGAALGAYFSPVMQLIGGLLNQ